MCPAAGPAAPLRPPPKCAGCGINRVAWTKPRVDYCYACLPGGPFAAPACSRCGSATYFSQGMCERCHPGGPEYLGSCTQCLAWGVYRRHNWQCTICRWWQGHYPTSECRFCGRRVPIGVQGGCRLCLETARLLAEPGRAPDLAEATRGGQQLFFANMPASRKPKQPRQSVRATGLVRMRMEQTALQAEGIAQQGFAQPGLFEMAPDPDVLRERATANARDITYLTDGIVFEHAERFGWSKRQTNQVRRSLKMLQLLNPGNSDGKTLALRASEVVRLRRYNSDGNVRSTLDVLDAAGLLIEDRPPPVERYFAGKTGGLPEPMRTQLALWYDVMLHGGATIAPRRKPRDPATVRIQILGMAPILTAWADAGHTSLAEISSDMLADALPAEPVQRHWAELGLRSLFAILKGRKLIFADPTHGMRITPSASSVPLPMDTEVIRDALDHPDPAIALAVALVAFHALTHAQVRTLKLTDIIDGRLTLGDGRTFPLAGPVRIRLAAWLDRRAAKWPRTLNPHLFVTQQSAPRLLPPGASFPWKKAGLSPQALRTDRILQEIHATGGDVRSVCDLFGLSIDSAMRYAQPPTPGSDIPTPETPGGHRHPD